MVSNSSDVLATCTPKEGLKVEVLKMLVLHAGDAKDMDNMAAELSVPYIGTNQTLFSLVESAQLEPLLRDIFGNNFDQKNPPKNLIVQRQRRLLRITDAKAKSNDRIKRILEKLHDCAAFILNRKDYREAYVSHLLHASYLVEMLRGALVVSGLEPNLKRHWSPDGGIAADTKDYEALMITGGRIYSLEDICHTCPMILHRSVQKCRILDRSCVMLANELFGGLIVDETKPAEKEKKHCDVHAGICIGSACKHFGCSATVNIRHLKRARPLIEEIFKSDKPKDLEKIEVIVGGDDNVEDAVEDEKKA